MATTEELIEVLGRAKILSGVRGWGEKTINEIIERLKEHEEIKGIIKNPHLTGDNTMRDLLKLVKSSK